MSAEHLINRLYLGDRACKAILVDAWKDRVAVQVDRFLG